ncbi:MAG: CsbD family protein [Weeksellaceae bacterium]
MSSFDDKVKGNWNQIKGELKQKWAELTDDDLLYAEGKKDEVLGRIQEKTGETKENIEKYINEISK